LCIGAIFTSTEGVISFMDDSDKDLHPAKILPIKPPGEYMFEKIAL
jgi:hypothetical protein